MELWVRSQDREDLIKADNIKIKHEYYQKEIKDNYGRISTYKNGRYKKSYIYNGSDWLGEYKTKERALEVLDEIQAIINNDNIESEEYDETSGCYYIVKKKVYEMPKE